MKRELKPARNISGTISVPGDKSISHRAALLSILASGPITIQNFADNEDCASSLQAAQAFGVKVERTDQGMTLTPPEKTMIEPDTIINCGNSGTTARLLAGLIAGSEHRVILSGDDSLSARPMKRVIEPLTAMGGEFFSDDNRLPLTIVGKKLLPFEYRMEVASAQVKSALLLAGLASGCTTVVREDHVTRDHTELMVAALGEGLEVRRIKAIVIADPNDPRKKKMVMPETFKTEITLAGAASIKGGTISVPGDFSTAAFFFAAAAISGGSVTVEKVGLNPTRTGFLTHLKNIGCQVEISDKQTVSGELRGTVTLTGGKLKARKICGDAVVGMIDEIPLVAVMAAFADGTTIIRDAAELKIKESDRLAAVADNLGLMGVNCGLLEDGLAIEGRADAGGADFKSYGDHRIAMAFTVASLFLDGPSSIDDDSVVAISCPNFFDLLDQLSA